MSEVSVEQRLKELLLKLLEGSVSSDQLAYDTPLINGGLSIDSMVQLRLLNSMEEEFDIEVDDDDVEESVFQNLTTLANYVRSKL
ncbi:phosphopantetheine-binding protein [Teredinibacter turnerae]|uniref:phosphopantetheine-binding protein n=1 Tax=Teredinibacter turnerae TaxID=2426 RepID=UPI000364DEFE|nr:phosphopantetheine-binding protein [Teredinibacter turnerae]